MKDDASPSSKPRTHSKARDSHESWPKLHVSWELEGLQKWASISTPLSEGLEEEGLWKKGMLLSYQAVSESPREP